MERVTTSRAMGGVNRRRMVVYCSEGHGGIVARENDEPWWAWCWWIMNGIGVERGLCIGFSVGMTAVFGPDFFDVRDGQVGYKFKGRS